MTITVQTFMTHNPHCIPAASTFGEAYRLMQRLDVRHLPVTLEGRIAGLVSQRDLLRLETQANIDRSSDPVSDAMTLDPYIVEPTEEVVRVVAEMAARKVGSAIVAVKNRVIGIFTTTDALQAFAAVLRRAAVDDRRLAPRAVGID